jgi:hypothetical protein
MSGGGGDGRGEGGLLAGTDVGTSSGHGDDEEGW